MTEDTEQKLDEDLQKVLDTQQVKTEPTLHQQLSAHETYVYKLRTRVNEVSITLQETYGRQLSEINARYARLALTLENERAEALRELTLDYERRKGELSAMLDRIDNNRA